ncbi:hypothetical protein GCM10011410_29610 [Hoyosella rhizosphaerae]|uniref:Uncharacterized protein n=1 Tax=Hoyosella rhizosphaerae TaxID=1755582 RepID=A0A916UIQ2_9ACTN|nr:hypothetical protein GCM10011410_29610 [Hoyosella rhizosphaerae]
MLVDWPMPVVVIPVLIGVPVLVFSVLIFRVLVFVVAAFARGMVVAVFIMTMLSFVPTFVVRIVTVAILVMSRRIRIVFIVSTIMPVLVTMFVVMVFVVVAVLVTVFVVVAVFIVVTMIVVVIVLKMNLVGINYARGRVSSIEDILYELVVPSAIEDDEVGILNGCDVSWAALVVMRIDSRVANESLDREIIATNLARDIRPHIGASDNSGEAVSAAVVDVVAAACGDAEREES